MKEFISVSPLRILAKSSQNQLGPGNLGVLIARAGVGKTACLIHIALHKIFLDEKLVHVSLNEGPEKVTSYYNVIYHDIVEALGLPEDCEYRFLMERNRMILAYLNRSFELSRLRANLANLSEKVAYRPNALIVDGLDFEHEERQVLQGFKSVAQEFELEIWFSALSHRHITETDEKGVPYPCHHVDDLFSVILHLLPTPSGVFMRLLKDHDHPAVSDTSVRLDPNTFLVMN
jgi:hypothetical protein